MERIVPADVQALMNSSSRSTLPVDLSDAQILRYKFRFMTVARRVCRKFEIPEEMKPAVNSLFRWCMRLPGNLDPQKGLWLWGDIGTGKSTMMRIINEFACQVRPEEKIGHNLHALPFCIYIRKAVDICDAYQSQGADGLLRYIYTDRLCIDDVGAENRLTGYYGTPTNVIGDLICRRYDRREKFQTFVTANISPEQICEIYGERVFDRCGELFNFVRFSGYSFRPPIRSI